MSSKTNNSGHGLPQSRPSQIVATRQEVSGPLPVSSEFAGYEAAFKGAADRILTMAEREATERHRGMRGLVRSQSFQSYAGPVLGFAIAAIALFLGYDLAKSGKELAGFASIATGALSMAGSVISALRRPRD